MALFVGNFERKSMAPAKNVVPTVESPEDHSLQEQIAKMMAMVETSAQQVAPANRVLEETRVELTAKIAKLH